MAQRVEDSGEGAGCPARRKEKEEKGDEYSEKPVSLKFLVGMFLWLV